MAWEGGGAQETVGQVVQYEVDQIWDLVKCN